MTFREGLNYVYKNRSSDLELTNPFVLYCRLSDLCSSSFEDKRKVVLFYQIDKKINVMKSIINNDFNVTSKYLEVAELLNEESFYGLINTVRKIVDPNYKEEAKVPVQKVVVKKPIVQKVVVQRAEETEQEESRTPLVNSYSSSTNGDIIGFCVFGGIVLTLALLMVFAGVFDWGWGFWQWIIGIPGGIVLLFIVSVVLIALNDNGIDYYGVGGIILVASVVINFILLLVLGANYKTIFGCLSVLEMIGGIFLLFSTFDDGEQGWGIFQTITTVTALILMIVGLILV